MSSAMHARVRLRAGGCPPRTHVWDVSASRPDFAERRPRRPRRASTAGPPYGLLGPLVRATCPARPRPGTPLTPCDSRLSDPDRASPRAHTLFASSLRRIAPSLLFLAPHLFHRSPDVSLEIVCAGAFVSI